MRKPFLWTILATASISLVTELHASVPTYVTHESMDSLMSEVESLPVRATKIDISEAKANELRNRFLKAETYAKSGSLEQFVTQIKGLEHYPLYPYLWFIRYKEHMDLVSIDMLEAFEKRYPTFSYHEELRRIWLTLQATQKNHDAFLDAYKPTNNLNLRCLYIQAKFEKNRTKESLKEIIPIWLEGKAEPGACTDLFSHAQNLGLITEKLKWHRIKNALAANNVQLATQLSQKMSASDHKFVQLWIHTLNHPTRVTSDAILTYEHPYITSLMTQAVIKLASSDPEAAVTAWNQLNEEYYFNKTDIIEVKNKIAAGLASKRSPLARAWLKKAIELEPSEQILTITITESLKRNDWKNVFGAISLMPKALQESDRWMYWKARALQHLDQNLEAKRIYRTLAKKKSYYGLLANERLGVPLDLKQDPLLYTTESVKKIEKHPCILAAKEWLALGRRAQANKEWSYGLSKMNEPESLAAARLAQDLHEYNWAITAVAKLGGKIHTHLKYPLAHYPVVLREANRQSIHPAWVFAITKQESAFSPRALSRVGAAGLMQLMPTTAKEVAKKQSVNFGHHSELFDVDLNLKLGSAYLNSVLGTFGGHHILATAAYNAGPGRVKQWLPERDLPADIWIETIPYNETRDYVKNVITFMQVYQHLLGEKPSMADYMKDIAAK